MRQKCEVSCILLTYKVKSKVSPTVLMVSHDAFLKILSQQEFRVYSVKILKIERVRVERASKACFRSGKRIYHVSNLCQIYHVSLSSFVDYLMCILFDTLCSNS